MSKSTSSSSFAGRLTKGAGTHLASWLQEVSSPTIEEAKSWVCDSNLDSSSLNNAILHSLQEQHGKTGGHSNSILDSAYSGELFVTKDEKSMRLWRVTGNVSKAQQQTQSQSDSHSDSLLIQFTLLRVVTACPGNKIAFGPTGQNIVTGPPWKVWGAGGGSAVGCGKTKIAREKG